MKKLFLTIITAIGLSFAQVAPSFLWDGTTDTQGKVETGSTEESAGFWYEYSDKDNKGTSGFVFPSTVVADEYDNFFGPLIEAFGGIKATVNMGTGYDYPFAGLGFNVWSEKQEGVDITAWGGLCVVYQSTLGFQVELGVADEATVTEYNNYTATLSPSTTIVAVDLPWTKFKQASGWGIAVDQSVVLTSTSSIKLKFSGDAGTTGDFLIQKVGSSGQCVATAKLHESSLESKELMLVGKTLFAKGEIEVRDLSGKLIRTGSTELNLSDLNSGLYIVKTKSTYRKIVLE